MVKVEKDLSRVPASLNGDATNRKRGAIIAANQYLSKDKKYDECYKKNDIKVELESIYHHKCAFCESYIEQWSVEHFRPKSIYYWLAYSWDNLLLACQTCNRHKDATFPISGVQAQYDGAFLASVHSITDIYDREELPDLVNPEKEDVTDLLIFDLKGRVSSPDPRLQRTIDICKLDRKKLAERRLKLWENLEDYLVSIINDKSIAQEEKINNIRPVLNKFMLETKKPETEFRAFRMYLLRNFVGDWLKKNLVENQTPS